MIKVAFKRILVFMPYVAAYFIALGLAALAFAFFGENVLFKDGAFSMVKVACYVPTDNALNSTGFSLIANMNSIENTVNFVECDSPDEVRDLVDEEEVVAGLIIPEGFASGIYSGANLELEVVFKSADTFDEQVVKDVMLVLANDLGVGQACTQTVYTFCDQEGIENSLTDELTSEVTTKELGYALDRLNIFKYESVDSISTYTLTQKIAGSLFVYVFLLSVFVFAYFCKGSNPAFIARAKLSGIPPFVFFLIEALSVAVMMYIAFAVIIIGLHFTSIGISLMALVRMLPIIALLALIVTGVSYLFKSPVSAAYISFAAFTVLMYLAGGLLPLEFLPRFLQEGAVYNPLKYVIAFTLEALFS